MGNSAVFVKDPSAVLDYTIDWLSWLGTDTITASTWTVETGITKVTSSFTTTKATIWLSGGTLGTTYAATNHITTAGNRQEDKTLYFVIQDK